MSKQSFVFRTINVRRAPGFEEGLPRIDGIGPAINIVHGPNASGKTTLARSLSAAIWPATADEMTHLLARFELGEDAWEVEVEGQRGGYRQNAQDTSAPPLPSKEQNDRYRLSLHDLLQHETRNESLARTILRESAGGYDLRAAVEALGFRESPSISRISECQEAEKAVEAVRKSRQQLQELRQKQNQLPQLRRSLEEAKEADRRCKLLQQAISYARVRRDFQEKKERLNAYPDVLEKMTGEEYARVEEIKKDIESFQENRREAEEDAKEARRKLREADLPSDAPPEGLLSELREMHENLRNAENEIREVEKEMAGATRRREEALGKVSDSVDTNKLDRIGQREWGELSDFAEKAEQLHADQKSWEALRKILAPETEPEDDVDDLRMERQALETWLSSGVDASENAFIHRYLPLLGIGVVALGGLVLGILLPPLPFVLLFSVLVMVCVAVVYVVSGRGQQEDELRQTQVKLVQQQDCPGPASWSSEDVRERLDEIYDALARNSIAKKRQSAWEARSDQLDELGKRAALIEERREELAQQIGAAPDISAVQLSTLSNHICRWQDANDNLSALASERQTLEEQRTDMCAAIGAKVEPFDHDEPEEASDVAGQIRRLEQRFGQHQQASQQLQTAKKMLDDADRQLERLTEKKGALFQKLELESGDLEGMQELCRQYSEYREHLEAFNSARTMMEREAAKLEQHPDSTPELKEKSPVELEAEKEDLARAAERKESLQKKITAIETKIESARHRHEVEDVMATRERALDALEERLEEDYAQMVGQVLADHVRKKSSEASRPEVFHRARRILTMITGRYSLEMMDGADAAFQVNDRVRGRLFSLDELSSATRVQVLLAVRMAFVEMQETSVRLPLLMDETLANTDDVKARAIIESAIELAREGRQVFYFTAQGDEVARWKEVLGRYEDVDCVVKDLARDMADVDTRVRVPDLETFRAELPSPPPPAGRSHGEYGRALDVPTLNPRDGAGAAHVWYVVEDVELLHRLLRMGVRHWGALDNILETGDQRAISDDPDAIRRIREAGAALEAFARAWCRGRGEPVDRATLVESGAVSNNFIDEVAELARELDGDARQLIESLEEGKVARFRSSKVEELEMYLEENGNIDPSPVLSRAEIRIRMATKLVDMGCSQEEAAERARRLLERFASGP